MDSKYLIVFGVIAVVIIAYVGLKVLVKKGIITVVQEESIVEEMTKVIGFASILLPNILVNEESKKVSNVILQYLNDAVSLVKNDVNKVDSVDNVYEAFVNILKQNNVVLGDTELASLKALIGTILVRLPVIGEPKQKELVASVISQ